MYAKSLRWLFKNWQYTVSRRNIFSLFLQTCSPFTWMAMIHKCEANLVFNHFFIWYIEKKCSVVVISFIFLRPGRHIL